MRTSNLQVILVQRGAGNNALDGIRIVSSLLGQTRPQLYSPGLIGEMP